MVHLVPANWNDPNPNATATATAAAAAAAAKNGARGRGARNAAARRLNVWAYSNADIVELFLNGKSLGTRKIIL